MEAQSLVLGIPEGLAENREQGWERGVQRLGTGMERGVQRLDGRPPGSWGGGHLSLSGLGDLLSVHPGGRGGH